MKNKRRLQIQNNMVYNKNHNKWQDNISKHNNNVSPLGPQK